MLRNLRPDFALPGEPAADGSGVHFYPPGQSGLPALAVKPFSNFSQFVGRHAALKTSPAYAASTNFSASVTSALSGSRDSFWHSSKR